MNSDKDKIRKAVISILKGDSPIPYEINQLNHLEIAVATRLHGRTEQGRDERLHEPEASLFLEVFWDLVIEKKVTIGLDYNNSQLPFFRIHSEARL